MASAQPISQPSHRGAPVSNNIQQAVSPPSKEQLKSWWTKFGRKKDKSEDQGPADRGIFGIPLSESIRYANVAISLSNEQGESFIYGYVPIVVAKCGVFLKEKATDVEGIFRLSGSAKRIKDLQIVFNSPERYGKGLDWTGYTVHDAANILRRYLNQLPEPIVPLSFYERFRNPLRAYQAKAGIETRGQTMEREEHAKAVAAYQQLLRELPPLNRQLLLYILDLLAVFDSKSDLNRMTAQNLAAIFQPGIISHPSHDMAPNEYRLSQEVLIFLIENQDNFLIGMSGTAMDEKTKDEVKSGPPSIKTPKPAVGLGRSASTASAGADSLRRATGIRRNASLSSRNSRDRASPNVSSPATPGSPAALGSTGSTSGLARSNTVPSNKSPAMQAGHRFQRMSEARTPDTPTTILPPTIPGSPSDERDQNTPDRVPGTDIRLPSQPIRTINNQIAEPAASTMAGQDLRQAQDFNPVTPINGKPNRDGKYKNLLSISPIFGPSDSLRDPNARQPRKLQKRRIPGSVNESAQSSQASLTADEGTFHTPMMTPNQFMHDRADPADQFPAMPNNTITPDNSKQPEALNTTSPTSPTTREARVPSSTLMPPGSPQGSLYSRGSVTDPSDLDALDDPANREENRRNKNNKWRLSRQGPQDNMSPLAPPPPIMGMGIGQNPGARGSNSSLGSNAHSHKPRKSFTGDSQATQTTNFDGSNSAGYPSTMNVSSRASGEILNNVVAPPTDPERKGFFGRMKAKIQQNRDDRERAKSPPPPPRGFAAGASDAGSRSSLTAFAHEHLSPRGRSFDRSRDDLLVPLPEENRGHERSGSRTPVPPVPGQLSGSVPGSAPVGSGNTYGSEIAHSHHDQAVPAIAGNYMSTNATPEAGFGIPARSMPSAVPSGSFLERMTPVEGETNTNMSDLSPPPLLGQPRTQSVGSANGSDRGSGRIVTTISTNGGSSMKVVELRPMSSALVEEMPQQMTGPMQARQKAQFEQLQQFQTQEQPMQGQEQASAGTGMNEVRGTSNEKV
ncbi:GTPase activating protein (GAP) for Rho1p [Lithohypha guttulata]|uniref:GTPase activating protein (GAP) for Rho1p n=1 Tax=Lithohypha guttulata TaxID=1690604 RepID=UPI002DE195E3|nr:GTPase activating protein (GAP) for Rho1p [Lithohypha guttulata]